MDADLSAALAPEALAPPIARDLGLREPAVIEVLRLLAAGAQPPFVARFRSDRIGGLELRDLEHIQARAAYAVAFEFKRAQLRQELIAHEKLDERAAPLLASACHPVELDDLQQLVRPRKRGVGALARARGLSELAAQLWACGSNGPLHAERTHLPATTPTELATQYPGRAPTGGSTRKRRRHRKRKPPLEESTEDQAAQSVPPSDDETLGAGPRAVVPPDDHSEPSKEVLAKEDSPEGSELVAASADSDPPAATVEETIEVRPASVSSNTASEADGGSEPAEPPESAPPWVPSVEDDLKDARLLIAEDAFAWPEFRRRLRNLVLEQGRLRASVVPGLEKKDRGGRYARLCERPEHLAHASAYYLLGVFRGEREGGLALSLEIDPEAFDALCEEVLGIDASSPCGEHLRQAMHEAWLGLPGQKVRQSARALIKQRADRAAIIEYCEAYRPLLLAPALGRQPVIAIDPGFASGCKVAVLSADGEVLVRDTTYPLEPKLQAPQAKARITELAKEHGVVAIVVNHGNGGRDVERLARAAVRESEGLEAVVVGGDTETAGLYASSRAAKQELPEDDASMRRAISAGRRLQDPLAELAKLDPRKLPLGSYQHEVDHEELRAALEQVLNSCVNEVGVDPNRESTDLLARIAGFNQALAKAVLSHRQQHGRFTTRHALLDVPGVAGPVFEQAAGFLRIEGGDNALDQTAIHPEHYDVVAQMARDVGVTVDELIGNPTLVDTLEADRYVNAANSGTEPLSPASLSAILQQLKSPGLDPRPSFDPVEFDAGVDRLEDLKVGMELTGIITHLASFGAFVDVGLPEEGLVHVSELSHGFVSNPFEAVYVGQRVRGQVLEVSPERKRLSLSLRALQPKPEGQSSESRRRHRSERNDGDRSSSPRDRGKGKGKGKGRSRHSDRGGTPGRGNSPKDRGGERVLGFKLDLSDLAARLGKD